MKSLVIVFLAGILCAASAAAQSPPPSQAASSEASLAGGMVINAALNTSIDSKKAKPGEQITAHTTEAVKSNDGRTILPKGTKLVGHVTQASARSNGQAESMLAIQFDKATLKDGQEVALNNAVIQAVAAPSQQTSAYGGESERSTIPATPSNNPSVSGSRGARPENTPSAQRYPSPNPDASSSGEANSAGPLPANTRGVYGLEGVRLSANANGEGTVLASTGKNVHLDGGTRLLLVVQPQSASAAPTGNR
jgi:Bacterial conjugation TrbI-like protein